MHLGWAAKKSSSFPRLIRLLNIARPRYGSVRVKNMLGDIQTDYANL
jgi:hypothetical protein